MATTNRAFIESVLVALVEDKALAGTRYLVSEIVTYLNSGLLKIAVARPDAVATTAAAHALAAGVKQGLPTGGFKLLEVLANGAGAAVTPVDRKILDACEPGWRALTGVTNILHCVFDPREPATWECYPPAAASGATVRLRYAAYPTPVTVPSDSANAASVTGDVPLPDLFINALREYVLFRAKSKDAEFAPGVLAAAQQHLALCERDLGVELNATVANAPRTALES